MPEAARGMEKTACLEGSAALVLIAMDSLVLTVIVNMTKRYELFKPYMISLILRFYNSILN